MLQENSRSWNGQPLRPFSTSAASFLRYSNPRSTRSPTRYVRSTRPISLARVPISKFTRINCFDVPPFGSEGRVHEPRGSFHKTFCVRLSTSAGRSGYGDSAVFPPRHDWIELSSADLCTHSLPDLTWRNHTFPTHVKTFVRAMRQHAGLTDVVSYRSCGYASVLGRTKHTMSPWLIIWIAGTRAVSR